MIGRVWWTPKGFQQWAQDPYALQSPTVSNTAFRVAESMALREGLVAVVEAYYYIYIGVGWSAWQRMAFCRAHVRHQNPVTASPVCGV